MGNRAEIRNTFNTIQERLAPLVEGLPSGFQDHVARTLLNLEIGFNDPMDPITDSNSGFSPTDLSDIWKAFENPQTPIHPSEALLARLTLEVNSLVDHCLLPKSSNKEIQRCLGTIRVILENPASPKSTKPIYDAIQIMRDNLKRVILEQGLSGNGPVSDFCEEHLCTIGRRLLDEI